MAGGKRNGAGRPKGKKDTRPRRSSKQGKEIAAKKLTPLDVLEKAMTVHYEAQRWDAAAAVAKDMAPYVHHRLNATTLKGDAQNPLRVVEELVIVDGHTDPPTPGTPDAGGLPA